MPLFFELSALLMTFTLAANLRNHQLEFIASHFA